MGSPDPKDQPEDSSAWETTVRRDILIGTRVGDYVVRRRIGAGGMGIVYEAEHPEIDRKVAVKILRPDVGHLQPAGLAGEARASGRIRHRTIVDVFGYGEIPDIGQYIVMEYLEGEPLDVLLERRGSLSPPEALWLLDEVLAGLGAAHAEGVVHRDLKPSNLFVVSASGGSQYVKILDFGLAKQTRRDERAPMSIGGDGSPRIMGTVEYMAPEQIQGDEVSGRTDLYALGVIAFELLTGQRPFGGESDVQVALAHLNHRPHRPSQLAPVPRELDDLVLGLLEKNPARRPADAVTVRRHIKELIQRHGSVTRIGQLPSPPSAPVEMGKEPGTTRRVRSNRSGRAEAARSRWIPWAVLGAAGLAVGAARTWLGPSETERSALAPTRTAAPVTAPAARAPGMARAQGTAPGQGTEPAKDTSPAQGTASAPETTPPQGVATPQEPPVTAPAPAVGPGDPPEPSSPPDPPESRPVRRGTPPPPVRVVSPPPPSEPTQEELLQRIEELRQRVQASAPPGGSPNPMMLTLLGRQEEAARAAVDVPARAKVARSLDAFEQQFEGSGDLKPR